MTAQELFEYLQDLPEEKRKEINVVFPIDSSLFLVDVVELDYFQYWNKGQSFDGKVLLIR